MERVPKQRAIFDRRQVAADIDHMIESGATGAPLRKAFLERMKMALANGRAEIGARLESGRDGAAQAAATAFLIDQIITVAFDMAAHRVFPEANPTATDRLSLVAVGGYGRGEMAPFSDVDLLFLHPYKTTPRGEQIVEYILYLLWDLGLTVGQATRSVDECIARAKRDITIRTTLLEARFIYGDQSLYADLRERFDRELVARTGLAFLEAKLKERDDRHQKMGDSRYVLEPNIKDGKGGLRDLHTLFWIAKYLYRCEAVGDLVARGVLTADERRTFRRAHRFLWTVRFFLHGLTNRAEERLTFDVQPAIAEAMQYTDHAGSRGVERFMKHYYLIAKDVGDLTRIFCADLEVKHQRRSPLSLPRLGGTRNIEGFAVERGRLTVRKDNSFKAEPIRMIKLFHVAHNHGLDIHPTALRLITRNLGQINARLRADREANRLFLEILTSRTNPEMTLRRMNEAGVLGRFIPDFGRVVAQTQHDMYHVYTVDEHTLFAIGILSRIEHGLLTEELPLASEIVHDVQSRAALYLSVFLHDIGKGRGGSHSDIGARIARKVGPRLGLSQEETETTSWLVQNHLLLSNAAFKRDLGDPKTIRDVAAIVQSAERLRLLLVLTVADIRAVGPNVWNGWKGELLRTLHRETAAALTGGYDEKDQIGRIAAAQDAVRAKLSDWSPDDVETFIARGYPAYWLSLNTETQVRHAQMMRDADRSGAPLHMETRIDSFRSVTELTLYAADHHGLFAGIAGAMAVCGASVVNARINTTTDGRAIDTFWIQDQDGNPFARPDRLARLSATIEQTLANDFKPADALARKTSLPSRTSVFKVAPRVLIDNRASTTHTVIEINARDRIGLIYDVARTLVALRLSVAIARINTFGERAVDVFYVKDPFGMKVVQQQKIEQVRAALLKAIAGETADIGAAVADAAE